MVALKLKFVKIDTEHKDNIFETNFNHKKLTPILHSKKFYNNLTNTKSI